MANYVLCYLLGVLTLPAYVLVEQFIKRRIALRALAAFPVCEGCGKRHPPMPPAFEALHRNLRETFNAAMKGIAESDAKDKGVKN